MYNFPLVVLLTVSVLYITSCNARFHSYESLWYEPEGELLYASLLSELRYPYRSLTYQTQFPYYSLDDELPSRRQISAYRSLLRPLLVDKRKDTGIHIENKGILKLNAHNDDNVKVIHI